MESQEVTSSIGRDPGLGVAFRLLLGRFGRRAERTRAPSYLLDGAEIPGEGWTSSSESNYRSVRRPLKSGPSLRCVGATRNYRHGTRYLFIAITVMDRSDDAILMIQRTRSDFIRRPQVEVTAEREMSGFDLPAIQDAQVYEKDTVRGSLHGYLRWIAGRVDNVVLAVLASGQDGDWEWDEAMRIATAQAEKIARLRSTQGS